MGGEGNQESEGINQTSLTTEQHSQVKESNEKQRSTDDFNVKFD